MNNNLKIVSIFVLSAVLSSCAHIKNSPSVTQVSWKKIPDVAQYKIADWKNEVKRVNGITLEEAMEIGREDISITFFFYVKGIQLYLEGKKGPNGWSEKGSFQQGDAVFFSGKPWYGSSPGLSDAYEKDHLN
jgi:hypothetical protein